MLESIHASFLKIWTSTFPTNLARAICIAVVAELVLYLTNWCIRKSIRPALAKAAGEDASARVRRRRIVLGIPLLLARTVIYVIALLMIARLFSFRAQEELYPVCLVILVLVAVAMKDVLRDAVRGYFITYDHLYGVGDDVRIGEVSGIVQEQALRHTTILTRDGKEIVIPSRSIETVTNFSRGLKSARTEG